MATLLTRPWQLSVLKQTSIFEISKFKYDQAHPKICRSSIEVETQILCWRSNADFCQVHRVVLHVVGTNLANLVIGLLLLQNLAGVSAASNGFGCELSTGLLHSCTDKVRALFGRFKAVLAHCIDVGLSARLLITWIRDHSDSCCGHCEGLQFARLASKFRSEELNDRHPGESSLYE